MQLIFYENTSIIGTVNRSVLDDSMNLANNLNNVYSINNINYELINDDSGKAISIIKSVSDDIYLRLNNFKDEYKNKKESDVRIYLPAFSTKIEELITETTEAIKERNDKIFDKYLPYSSFSYDSCFFKIMKANPLIIDELFKIVDEVGWNKAMTLGLLAEIRLMTNRALAYENSQAYLPSTKRSRLINISKLIFEKVESELSEKSKQFKVEIPSIVEHLVEKGKGNPNDIIKITCDLREKFLPFREYIDNNETINNRELDNIIRDIIDKYFNGYKKGRLKIFLDNILTFIKIDPVPIPLPVPNIIKMDKEFKINKCVQVFAKVVDDMENKGSIGYKELLIKNCMKD